MAMAMALQAADASRLLGAAGSSGSIARGQPLSLLNATGRANSTHLTFSDRWVLNVALPGDPDVHDDWDHEPFKDPDVVKKYTDAESVSEVLFVIACKAKHKNDIDGMARDKAKVEKFTEKEFQGYVKELQAGNIAQMKETCGHVNTKASKECSEHCTKNWASGGAYSLPMEKQRCTEMCTKKHGAWEEECKEKVGELQNVYIAEQGNLANTKKCQEIHCKAFPQTLMMKDDEAKEAKKEGCKEMCTEKQIKAKCVKRWNLQGSAVAIVVQEECQEKTKKDKLEPCVDDGTGEAEGKHDECKDKGNKDCEDEKKKCMDDAKAAGEDSMVGANADSICGVREETCKNQVTAKCQGAHKKNLKKMEKKCMKEHKEEMEKCIDEKMDKKEKDFKKKCKDDITPTCKEDCAKNCDIPEMRKCQKDMIKKAFAVTAKYCTSLWRWIFDSEQFDKVTMDPIPKSVGGGRFKLIKRAGEKDEK